MRALTSAAVGCWLLAGAVAQQAGYRFVIDGTEKERRFVSLAGAPESPQPGDLVDILGNDVLVRLDAPGEYVITNRWKEAGQLVRRIGDADVVIAVTADRLVELDDDALARLRGVKLERWDERVAAAVAKLAADVPLYVTEGAALGESRTLPPLPRTTRHLLLSWESRDGFDLRPARALTALRSLQLDGRWSSSEAPIDLSVFAGAADLRYLAVDQGNVASGETIRAFTELRELALGDSTRAEWIDVAWFTGCSELRRLDLGFSERPSIAALAPLPGLRDLTAHATTLPAAGFVGLRRLSIPPNTGDEEHLPLDQLRAFRNAHPLCDVYARVVPEVLPEALAKADRVRVREMRDSVDAVLFDSNELATVRDVASFLAVVPNESWMRFGTWGNPTIDFFRGTEPIAALSLIGGRILRWENGPWNSDAFLDDASGARLTEWLAKIGAPGPRQDRRDDETRWAAERNRTRQRAKVFGETIGDDDPTGTETSWLPRLDVPGGPRLALRLLGLHVSAWNAADGFDRAVVEKLADAVTDAEWAKWIEFARTDAQIADGLAAAFAANGVRDKLGVDARLAALPIVAVAGLTHPHPWNRARTLQLLRDDANDASLAILRDALRGTFAPRPAADHELVSPGGMVEVHPSDPVLDAQRASVPALAARCLAARGDTASADTIRSLAESATSFDRRVLTQALRDLEGK